MFYLQARQNISPVPVCDALIQQSWGRCSAPYSAPSARLSRVGTWSQQTQLLDLTAKLTGNVLSVKNLKLIPS